MSRREGRWPDARDTTPYAIQHSVHSVRAMAGSLGIGGAGVRAALHATVPPALYLSQLLGKEST